MTRKDFFGMLLLECDIEGEVNENTVCEELEEWDSLSMITIISIFKTKFNHTLTIVDVRGCNTFKDILDIAENYYEK